MSTAVLFSPSRDWAAIHARLRPRYDEGQRHYHSWPHIESLLEWFVEVNPMLHEPEAVHFAILYHDAIYDPRASDNEIRSEELFRKEWGGSLPGATIHAVSEMILATISHELVGGGPDSDQAYFLDMDLAILGAPHEDFDAYDGAIRLEYSHVAEAAFRKGRRAILERILARPQLYFTEYFADRLEAQARDNLTRAIAALK